MRGSLEHDGKRGSANHSNAMLDASVANVGTLTHQNKKTHICTSYTEYCSTKTKNTVTGRTIVVTTLDQSDHGDTHTHVREIS